MSSLLEWNESTFGNVQKEIKRCTAKLKGASDVHRCKVLFSELRGWRQKEEILWWQGSKTQFLQYRDQNSA